MTTPGQAFADALAPKIADILDATCITRSDIAERVGVVTSAVSMALDPAKYPPNVGLLVRIASELRHDVTVNVTATVRPQRAAERVELAAPLSGEGAAADTPCIRSEAAPLDATRDTASAMAGARGI